MSEPVDFQSRHVHCWHVADVNDADENVCRRMKGGRPGSKARCRLMTRTRSCGHLQAIFIQPSLSRLDQEG